MDRLERRPETPQHQSKKTGSGNGPGHTPKGILATLTINLQKTNNRHFKLNRYSFLKQEEGHCQKGRHEAGPHIPNRNYRRWADAARADFLKAKAKEVSLKGKAAKKKDKGKAEATAGADEMPKDWVELDTVTYETTGEGQLGPRRDADPQLEQDQE